MENVTVLPESTIFIVEELGMFDGIERIRVKGSSRDLFVSNRIFAAAVEK